MKIEGKYNYSAIYCLKNTIDDRCYVGSAKKLNTHNPKFGYNLLGTGEIGLITHSLESREKISKALKGRKLSSEHKEKNRLGQLGKKHSQEHKDKVIKTIEEGCKKGRIKLNEVQVLEIVKLINQGIKTTIIAKQFNVSRHTISGIKYNKNWNFINKGNIKQNKSRLSLEQIAEVRNKANNKIKYKDISLEYNIPFSMISKIKNNLNYGL